MAGAFFSKKNNGAVIVRLHKDLYKAQTIEQIRKEEPQMVKSFKRQHDYYFVELASQDSDSHFRFVNYLIYRTRNQ